MHFAGVFGGADPDISAAASTTAENTRSVYGDSSVLLIAVREFAARHLTFLERLQELQQQVGVLAVCVSAPLYEPIYLCKREHNFDGTQLWVFLKEPHCFSNGDTLTLYPSPTLAPAPTHRKMQRQIQ